MGLVALCVLVPGHALGAQTPAFTGTTLRQTILERWMNDGQREAMTRFVSRTERFRVTRDVRGDAGATVVLRGGTNTADSTLLFVAANGAPTVRYYLRTVGPGTRMTARDSVRMGRFALLDGSLQSRMTLIMPAARFWDLARSTPAVMRVGTRWVDTVRFETAHDGARVAVNGTRVSRVVRDTTVGGRPMLVVRDSALVTYEERFLIEAYVLDTTEQVERRATGVIRGQWLFDPEHAFVAWSADTTTLRGTATLRSVDGRVAATPTRFERMRELKALTPAEVAALESGAQPFSIVRVPFTDLEKRMAREGPAITDSLLRVVRESRDPIERDRLLRALADWGRVPRVRLSAEMLAVGDTTRALEYTSLRWSAPWLREWLPVLDDPARLWRHGVAPVENFTEGVAGDLTQWPPVAIAFLMRNRDASRFSDVTCQPEACQVLAGLWPSARDPRLRALGLLARATLDPRTWGDTLRRNVSLAPGLLTRPVALLDGIAAEWGAPSRRTLPEPGAPWQRWSEWMTGFAPGSSRPPFAGRPGPPIPLTEFNERHLAAMAMSAAVTGRDIKSELRDGYGSAMSDSARHVFGTMAVRVNALPLTSDLIASWLSDSSAMVSSLGRNALDTFLADSAKRLSDTDAAPLVDTLLAILIDKAPRWRTLGIDATQLRSFPAEMQPGSLRLSPADSLPAAVVNRWAGKLRPVPSAERSVPDDQLPATTYWISPPMGAGRIVVLRYSLTTQRGAQAYSQGSVFYLLRMGEEFRLVAISSWIT